MTNRILDDIDLSLLRSLRANARVSVATLAAEHHVSRATAYNRIQRLRSDGALESFTVMVNTTKVGLPLSALILLVTVNNVPFSWTTSGPVLAALPEVQVAAETTGEFDAFLIARFRDNDHLRDFLDRVLLSVEGIGRSRTHILLNESAPWQPVLPAD